MLLHERMYSYFSTLSGISPFSVKRLSCVYAKNVWKYLLNSQHCEKKDYISLSFSRYLIKIFAEY